MKGSASRGMTESRGRRSPLIAAAGAAIIAGGVTTAVMMSNQPPGASVSSSDSATKQCQMIPRKLLISTSDGGGTVRFRASGYVSQSFTLTTAPQALVFPLPRSETIPIEEEITVEGSARNLVITSEVSDYRRVIDSVAGTQVFSVTWKPMKGC